MAGGATVDPSRSGPQRVEGPVASVEVEAAVHRLPGADRLDAGDDVRGSRHEGREVRDHEDDEADEGERPQDREDGSSSGRSRRRPVGPRRRREAAARTEISSKQGAAARARPSHWLALRGGRGHRRCAATRTETTFENRAATDALHPFAHEGPALFNGAVLDLRGRSGARFAREDLYRFGRFRGSPSRAAEASDEHGGMKAWNMRSEAGGTPTSVRDDSIGESEFWAEQFPRNRAGASDHLRGDEGIHLRVPRVLSSGQDGAIQAFSHDSGRAEVRAFVADRIRSL